MKKTITILEAMKDEQLFRSTFKRSLLGNDTWWGWRVFLSALFALPLDEKQLQFFKEHSGREQAPSKQAQEAYVIAGRRSGKTLTAALIAVFLAAFKDYSDVLAPGEWGTLMILSADRKQGRTILSYVNAFLSIPLLAEMVLSRRTESIDLNNHIRIEIHTSSYKATRGYTVVGCVADEVCFWSTEEGSANPDVEVLAAVRPAMATVSDALLICISSPYSKKGEMWAQYRQNWAQENPDILIWQADSRSMNPSLNPLTVKMAYVRDAASARAEYGGMFRDDVETFISLEQLESRIVAGRRELPYRSNMTYVGFADPSGGRADSFVLAIAHLESGKAVLDVIREIQAPFSPEAAVQELSGICKAYKVTELIGDSYGGEWAKESFAKWGVNYRLSDKNRSELYLAFLPLLMSDQVVLLDSPRLVNQLCSLERRTARSGRDSIDHPIGGHDDIANAVCGALTLIATENITGRLGVLELHREIAEGKRPMPGTKPVSVAGYRRQECPPCSLGKNRDGSKAEGHATRYSPTWQVLCDCGSIDGEMPAKPIVGNVCPVEGCGLPLRTLPGGDRWCANHGQFSSGVAMAKQMTFAQYKGGARARGFGMGQFAVDAHSDDSISNKIDHMFDLITNKGRR
jgi:hypothetical protein